MVDRVTFAGTTFAPVPLKFEAGTANFVGAIALGRAVEFLQEFDPAEIEAHETALLRHRNASRPSTGSSLRDDRRQVRDRLVQRRGVHHDMGMILDKLGSPSAR